MRSKSSNNILNLLYKGTTTIQDFCWDNMTTTPILCLIPANEIEYIKRIILSARYSGNNRLKMQKIDEVMNFRGFSRFAGGTNRLVYTHPDAPNAVFKVAIDSVGITDNPAEFKNQQFLKPYCCKVFECSPCGTIASFEKVERITTFEEFYSIADDYFYILSRVILGKYVMEDIGIDYFMNIGIRKGCHPVILDFPYLFELDGRKLECINKLDDGSICHGDIDYDSGFNKLVCKKCGRVYRARDLALPPKQGGILLKQGGANMLNMKMTDNQTGEVIIDDNINGEKEFLSANDNRKVVHHAKPYHFTIPKFDNSTNFTSQKPNPTSTKVKEEDSSVNHIYSLTHNVKAHVAHIPMESDNTNTHKEMSNENVHEEIRTITVEHTREINFAEGVMDAFGCNTSDEVISILESSNWDLRMKSIGFYLPGEPKIEELFTISENILNTDVTDVLNIDSIDQLKDIIINDQFANAIAMNIDRICSTNTEEDEDVEEDDDHPHNKEDFDLEDLGFDHITIDRIGYNDPDHLLILIKNDKFIEEMVAKGFSRSEADYIADVVNRYAVDNDIDVESIETTDENDSNMAPAIYFDDDENTNTENDVAPVVHEEEVEEKDPNYVFEFTDVIPSIEEADPNVYYCKRFDKNTSVDQYEGVKDPTMISDLLFEIYHIVNDKMTRVSFNYDTNEFEAFEETDAEPVEESSDIIDLINDIKSTAKKPYLNTSDVLNGNYPHPFYSSDK